MSLLVSFLFAGLTLLAISLQKTYKHIPLRELKRRARAGDEAAGLLHRAAAYGISLDIILWLIIGASAAAFMIIFSRSFSSWLAFFGAASLLWFGFAWIPKSRSGRASLVIAKYLAPTFSWLASKLHPLTRAVKNLVERHRPVIFHSGLYEKEDLLELLTNQKSAANNRIDTNEINIAINALEFADHTIRDVMTPRRMVKFVNVNDPIGPVLLGELHNSGFSRFPVSSNKKNEEVVGTLYLHDLVDKQVSGRVQDHMSKKVYYVSEEQNLRHALSAFLKTKHHMFVVINNFEEVVGVISIEDILEEILGKEIVDEFDQHEDLRAVAQLQAQSDRQKHEEIQPQNEEKENENEQ